MAVSRSQRMLSLWLSRLSTDRIVRSRETAARPLAPSPRVRGEGWGEGASRDAQTRGNAPSPASPPLSLRRGDLSPHAGRGEEGAHLAVYGKRGNADVLVAVDAAAARLGLSVGLALTQARAMHPALDAVPEDTQADAQLLDAVADWCLRYTPLVACDAPDGLLMDITGCAHLYGGEQALIADLAARLERAGFAFSMAVAGSIGAAHAAARFGAAGRHANGDERKVLTPLPLAALRLPPQTVASLARVGLKRIGDIIDLPRSPLTARFGGDVIRQLDRALALEDEPLTPRLPVAPYVAEQRFADPIAREEDVLAVTERLAQRLKSALERRGDGARRIELTLFRTDGAVRRIAAGTSRPMRDAAEIRALFTERLAALADAFDPGFGFDMARLSVLIAEPCAPEQIGIGEIGRAHV